LVPTKEFIHAKRKQENHMLFYLPIMLMILGTTAYHIAQKSVPAQLNPLFSLALNYFTAFAGTLLLIPLYPSRSAGPWSPKGINWASLAVGLFIVAVELSVLLAYRTGWRISLLSTLGNTASALLLVAVGLLFFHEHISTRNLAGVLLCLVGLTLISQR
jgi:drug/metabolite transporter (DMT)-like permease